MNIDEQIKQALNDEVQEFKAQNAAIDASPFKQMKAGFSGKMKWIYLQVMFFIILLFGCMVYAIYRFYYEQELKALLGWAVAIIVFALIGQLGKMWYWSEMGRNRVIREVKVLELQLAQLADKINHNR